MCQSRPEGVSAPGIFALSLVLGSLLAGSPGVAENPDSISPQAELTVGTEVVLAEPGTMLRDGDRQLPSRGECVFRVERLERGFADIATDDRSVRGWVQLDQVLPLDKAIDHFSRIIARDPKDAEAYQARGQIWIEKEQWDNALTDLGMALELAPKRDASMAVALRDRGLAWDAKRFFDRAFADLTEAIGLDPSNPGLVLTRGRICAHRGRTRQAMADIDWYVQMRPNDPAGYKARGEAFMENFESEAAINEFTRAIEVDPTYVSALRLRAETWSRRKDFASTVSDYTEASRRNPDDAESHRALAWILATCIRPEVRDGPRAVREGTTACELTHWTDIDCLTALAAAYAEAGDFSNAAKWQARVVKLLPKRDKRRQLYEARLFMYQAGKPYRD